MAGIGFGMAETKAVSDDEDQTLLPQSERSAPSRGGLRKWVAATAALLGTLALMRVASDRGARHGLRSSTGSMFVELSDGTVEQKLPIPSTSNDTLHNASSIWPDGIRWGQEVFGGGAAYDSTRGEHHNRTKLFCFSVVSVDVKGSNELDLLRYQWKHQVGIFQCDAARVYGDTNLSLELGNKSAPHIIPHHMPASEIHGPFGKGFFSNRPTFNKVLDMIHEDGAFKNFDVVVKADPDLVLVPKRLRARLAIRRPAEEPWYFANCNSSQIQYVTMQGPLEVFSRGMVERFNKTARDRDCLMTKAEHVMAGEDMFLDRCMHWIGGHRLMDLNLVSDGFCDWPMDESCANHTLPAYHGFKDVDAWAKCLNGTLLGARRR